MKKNNSSAGWRDPDGKNGIKAGSRFTNKVPRFDGGGCWQQHLQIVQAIVKSNGWSEGTVRASGWRGLECSLIDDGAGKGKMGRSIKRSFGVLQLPRETSGVPAAIRERDSPTGSGSGYVCHRAGNPCSAGVRRYGQARP